MVRIVFEVVLKVSEIYVLSESEICEFFNKVCQILVAPFLYPTVFVGSEGNRRYLCLKLRLSATDTRCLVKKILLPPSIADDGRVLVKMGTLLGVVKSVANIALGESEQDTVSFMISKQDKTCRLTPQISTSEALGKQKACIIEFQIDG